MGVAQRTDQTRNEVEMSMNAGISPVVSAGWIAQRSPALSAIMSCALQSMSSRTLEQVVDCAVRHIEDCGGDASLGIDETLACLSSESGEEEAEHIPLHVLAGGQSSTPLDLAQAYLRATRYLLPTLHAFSCSLVSVAERRGKRMPIYLFMRDSLAFWPCLRALDAVAPEQLKLLFFSRNDARNGLAPVMLGQTPDGLLVEEHVERLERGLLVDCGLYGSLVRVLIESGRATKNVSVMFLGSRSPFLAGWFNMGLSARMLDGNATIDLQDIIRLVDTVESLLKPFRASSFARLERSDANSFICAMAFMWALYRYSREHPVPPTFDTCLRQLRQAWRGGDVWLVDRTVPRWQEADEFIRGWDLGPIDPMNMFCGFDL
jgi:hypothetical protein